MDLRERIADHLGKARHCVIATAGDNGQPEAATVGFAETKQLELIIGTHKSTRKAANIALNPKVAVVVTVGWVTVQCEGSARILEEEEAERYKSLHVAKDKDWERFANDPNQRYILITPSWFRYTNFTVSPPVIEEQRP